MHIAIALVLAGLTVSAAAAAPPVKFSKAEETAIFRAAGFARQGAQWRSACDDPGTASYTSGAVEPAGDLNGDGRPEALVTEGGAYCYGNTGTAFWLLSKQDNGGWKLIHNDTGVAGFLKTKGANGWPDISVGGPGFCFPVLRWNGRAYVLNRHEYEGRSCRG